jgi:HlyD family secretion protein
LRVRIAGVEPAAAGASAPNGAASGISTGDARVWSFFSEAVAQTPGGGQGGAGGAGGGLAAQRERLVSELGLNAQQQDRLEAISAELRPKFMAMRELPEDQRPAARDKAMAEMREKISAMLTPEQRSKYEQMPRPGSQNATNNIATPAGPTRATGQKAPEKKAETAKTETGSAGAKPAAPAPAPAPAPAAGAGGGPQAEFRNRLVSELQLSADQAARLDALNADMRPRFMALRDLPQEDRPKARDRIMADQRARIGDLLTPEQKVKYAAMLAESAGRANTRGRIYLMGEDGKPKAFNVRLGITDGSSTELIVAAGGPAAGELKEGAVVITGIQPAGTPAAGATRPSTGPRLPF